MRVPPLSTPSTPRLRNGRRQGPRSIPQLRPTVASTGLSSLGRSTLRRSLGRFYFGGFTSNGNSSRSTVITRPRTFEYKGYVDTSTGAGSTNNGDIAFDSQGNLFIVRGSGTTTTIFSVTNDALAAAGG